MMSKLNKLSGKQADRLAWGSVDLLPTSSDEDRVWNNAKSIWKSIFSAVILVSRHSTPPRQDKHWEAIDIYWSSWAKCSHNCDSFQVTWTSLCKTFEFSNAPISIFWIIPLDNTIFWIIPVPKFFACWNLITAYQNISD